MSNISRWDPFQDVLTLREAMNQLLEESFVRSGQTRGGQGFVPALDLSETEDGFLIEAVLPGLRPEDLEISVENHVLTIKGEVRQDASHKNRSYHRLERRYGSFQRVIGLPSGVKSDAIKATLNHGILRLEIPKAEEVKPRRISVSVGENQPIAVHNN